MTFCSGKLLLNALSPPKSPLEGEGTLHSCSVQHRRCGDAWSILTMVLSRAGADLRISTISNLETQNQTWVCKTSSDYQKWNKTSQFDVGEFQHPSLSTFVLRNGLSGGSLSPLP